MKTYFVCYRFSGPPGKEFVKGTLIKAVDAFDAWGQIKDFWENPKNTTSREVDLDYIAVVE